MPEDFLIDVVELEESLLLTYGCGQREECGEGGRGRCRVRRGEKDRRDRQDGEDWRLFVHENLRRHSSTLLLSLSCCSHPVPESDYEGKLAQAMQYRTTRTHRDTKAPWV